MAALHLRSPSPGFSRATSIPGPHPNLGRLRVLLLRQTSVVSPGISFAVIQLWYYLTMDAPACQSCIFTKCPQSRDGYSPYIDRMPGATLPGIEILPRGKHPVTVRRAFVPERGKVFWILFLSRKRIKAPVRRPRREWRRPPAECSPHPAPYGGAA